MNYCYYSEDVLRLTTDCFYDCLHELMMDMTLRNSQKASTIHIVAKNYSNKKHNELYDSLLVASSFKVYSCVKDKYYDLKTYGDLYDLLDIYENIKKPISALSLRILQNIVQSVETGLDHIVENRQARKRIFKNEIMNPLFVDKFYKNDNFNEKNGHSSVGQYAEANDGIVTPDKKYEFFENHFPQMKDDLYYTLQTALNNAESLNVKSKLTPDENNENATFSDESRGSVDDDFLDKLDEEIKNIEEKKNKLDFIVENVTEQLNDDKHNLSDFSCEVSKNKYDLRKEKEKQEEALNVFLNDKNSVYPKIYNNFFVNKTIKSWADVPSLFLLKFSIFLYMDGKNTEGETVREKTINTDDAYRIYKMLYDVLTDGNFEMPENEKDNEYIIDFLDTYPPIPIITDRQVLSSLNDSDDELFTTDIIPPNEGDDTTERKKGNETYGGN